MKNWMKCLVAVIAVACFSLVVEEADARHRGSREVVRTRTVVRGAPRSSFRSHHRSSFNSFRSYDPCYCDDEVVEIREFRSFRH